MSYIYMLYEFTHSLASIKIWLAENIFLSCGHLKLSMFKMLKE